MKFACDRCQTRYMIPDEKVRPGGVKVRCKKCEHIILVKPSGVVPAGGAAQSPSPRKGKAVPAGGPGAAARGSSQSKPAAAGVGAAAGEATSASQGERGGGDGLDEELGAAFDSVMGGGGGGPSLRGDEEAALPPSESPIAAPAGDAPSSGAPAAAEAPSDQPAAASGEEAKASSPEGDAQREAAPKEVAQPVAKQGSERPRRGPLPDPDAEWFLAINDEQVGPVDWKELLALWERAEIGPDTLCWRSGLVDWTKLSELDELASVLAPRPSAGQPSGQSEAPGSQERREPWDNTVVGATEPEEGGWKPGAASALSALVQREVQAAESGAPSQRGPEAAEEEEPLPPAHENTGIRLLLRGLPDDAPAQEPSRFIPLQQKAGGPAAPAPAQAPAVAAREPKRRSSLLYVVGGLLLSIPLVAAGAWFGGLFDTGAGEAPVMEAPAAPAATQEEPPAETAAEALAAAAGGASGESAAGGSSGESEEGGELAEAAAEDEEEETKAEATAEAEAAKAEAAKAEAPKADPPKVASRPAQPRQQRSRPQPSTSQRQRQRAEPRQQQRRQEPAQPPARQRSSAGSNDILSPGSRSSIDELFEREFASSSETQSSSGSGSKTGSSTYIPPAPGGGAPLPAQLGQGDITAVVFSQRAELQRCAAAYKASGGASSGTLVMRWSIEPNGRTSGVQPIKGAEHAQFANCISELVKGWRFPAYAGPKMQPIDFPFSF